MDPIYTAATQNGELSAVIIGFFVLFYVALFVGVLWVYAKIVTKAGYPWPWIFIMFVPIVNIVFLCLFAFKAWPIEQELAATRQALLMATGSPYPGGFSGMRSGGQYGVQPAYDHGGYRADLEPGYQPGYDQGGYPQRSPGDNPYAPKY